MRKKQKKAMMEDLMRIIIGAAVLILVIFAFFLLKDKLISKDEQSLCERNVRKHVAMVSVGVDPELSLSQIHCPTRNNTITKSKPNDIKRELANEMRQCWKEWLKGEEELFYGNGIFCHTCSVIDFKHKDKQIEDFREFLETEYVDKKTTYMGYFSPYTTMDANEFRDKFDMPDINSNIFQQELLEQQDVTQEQIDQAENSATEPDGVVIDTSKKYGTMFVYARGIDDIEKLLLTLDKSFSSHKVLGVGGGVALGGVGLAAVGLKMGIIAGAGLTVTGVGVIIVGGVIIGVTIAHVLHESEAEATDWIAMPLFVEWNENTLEDLGCYAGAAAELPP